MNRAKAVHPVNRSAVLSADGRHRYHLTRTWGDGDRAVFVMLNPSTADAYSDDPTIRRCIGYARAWGLDGIEVVNLYGLRATNPADLWRTDDPVGPENDRWLAAAGLSPYALIAAWGVHARQDRVEAVISLPGYERLTCLNVTQDGAPAHPLYQPTMASLRPWPDARIESRN